MALKPARTSSRTWPIIAAGTGMMVIGFAVSGIGLYRDYKQIYADETSAQRAYEKRERLLDLIRSELYACGIYARDYLLDPGAGNDSIEQREVAKLRESLAVHIGELDQAFGSLEVSALPELARGVQQQSAVIDAIFGWEAGEKTRRTHEFLSRELVPFRMAAFRVLTDMDRLNDNELELRRRSLRQAQDHAEAHLLWVISAVCLFSAIIAAVLVKRTRMFEEQSRAHGLEIEAEREELRDLSNKLVSGREEERTAVARELQEAVGQLVTALKIELVHLDASREAGEADFAEHMRRARELADQSLRGIRTLATGLRPAVLDELGVEAAARWQAREHARSTGVRAAVQITGDLDALPYPHRTCAYRVIEEALKNCARHAGARAVQIRLERGAESIEIMVQDDGLGFDPDGPAHAGYGLRAMKERVHDLGGSIDISSERGAGTRLLVVLPLQERMTRS